MANMLAFVLPSCNVCVCWMAFGLWVASRDEILWGRKSHSPLKALDDPTRLAYIILFV